MTDQLDDRAPLADPGFVLRFQDNREPAVPAGKFRITATQTITDLDTGTYLDPVHEDFEVRAPQFALDPELVHAVNPAPHAAADFTTTLAHVTLTDPLLPWKRHLAETDRAEPTAPWLALLLFAQGELPDDPGADAATTTMTARQLLTDAPGIRHPGIGEQQIEGDPDAPCATVDIPGDIFQTVVPRTDELRHLLHVRDVRPDPGLRGEQLAEGEFAVVVASRLPDRTTETRYSAHLVSLEGCRSILKNADDGTLTAHVRIRLAALHSWAFTSIPDEAGGFPGRVRNFLRDQNDNKRDLLLRLPQAPPTPPPGADPAAHTAAHARLASGHIPLPYRVETGEDTYAWYRGPFTAEPAQPLPPTPEEGWTSAAQLLAYEQAWGVFDTSRAAAWTLGRALALADADFTAMLTAWHAKARARAAAMAQRLTAPGLDAAEPPTPTDTAAEAHAATGTDATPLTETEAAADTEADVEQAAFTARQTRALGHRPFGTLLEDLVADGSAARLLRAATHPANARNTPPPTPRRRGAAPGRRGQGRAARAANLLADPPAAMRTALADLLALEGAPIVAWLDRLRLLHGVPFADLVPDERMLPAESLRLFHVDAGWPTALAAGAAGIAITGDNDTDITHMAAPWAHGGNADPPRAGVLIRSALVHECPGLLVRPYRGHEPTRTPIRVLRQDTLASDVLLVLFADVPDEIELAEPPEGLSFGIDTASGGVRVIGLRRLDAPVAQELGGHAFPAPAGTGGLDAYLRPDPSGSPAILDLRPAEPAALLGALKTRLLDLEQSAAAGFGPAGLAVQLVNTPRRQLITRAAPTTPQTSTTGRNAQ
ncbi:hypothetical protein ACFZBU_43440 [Embleya sp. NPDC008237]|uniref:hypothetical protein n=1 Tax=Embleya sp. NPDC008237 TaxID=3363978 RepID=UPI0036E6768C